MRSGPIHISPGVLAQQQLASLVKQAFVSKSEFDQPEVDGSAIDLRLGKRAWRIPSGQRPTSRELSTILRGQSEPLHVEDGHFHFAQKGIYLVELDQHLKLPSNISGRASGKSSVGRLDVITRLITSGSREYDVVSAGYEGPLHLLLMPQTFAIRVQPGSSLNQLRLFSGAHFDAIINRDELYHYGTQFWYTLKADSDDEYECWVESPERDITDDPLLFDLTVDLGDPRYPYVFRALKGVVEPLVLDKKGVHDPAKYFVQHDIKSDGPDRWVELEPDEFYIMKSRERLFIPQDVAVEVVAISERIGDIRIHYAGFAHPNFGRATRRPGERRGTPLIFEVRATDMKTKLYHGSVLARIQLFRMSQPIESEKTELEKDAGDAIKAGPSGYETQELKLSNVFADWPARTP